MELIRMSGPVAVAREYASPGLAPVLAERPDPNLPFRVEVASGSLVVLKVAAGSVLVVGSDGQRSVAPDRHILLTDASLLDITATPGTCVLVGALAEPIHTAILGADSAVPQGVRPLGGARSLLGELDGLAGQVLGSLALAIERPLGIDLAQHGAVEDDGTQRVIERLRLHQRPGLKDAAELAGYSHFHFSRRFKDLTGYGYHEYIDRMRTGRALERAARATSATELASENGFSSLKTLRESVRDYTGLDLSQILA